LKSLPFMNDSPKHNIPFTTFFGSLKQLRLSAIEPIQARLFRETFPSFFSIIDPPENSKDLKRLVESASPKFQYREATELPRRFAGEPALRRGCYYSVCRSGSGDDGGTLRNEVCAYRDPNISGRVYVLDLSLEKNPFTGENMEALLVCWSSPTKSKLAQDLLASKSKPDEQQILVLEFPYDVIEVVLDNIVDLRFPHVRKWFYETFSSEQKDGSIAWILGQRLKNAITPLRKDVESSCVTKSSRFHVQAKIPPVPTCFAEMLPTLMNPDLGGGSPADSGSSLQAIGTWMRQNDVKALIYPSARCDVSVEIVDGKIAAFSGWNLVDYRNDPPRAKYTYFEQSPWCWTGFSPSINFEGEPSGLGSFRIAGMEAYWRRDYEGLLSAHDALETHCLNEKLFEDNVGLTVIGSWRLGEVSVEWLRKNAVEKNIEGAAKAFNLFKGCLIRLREFQKAGLIDELSLTLPRTQDVARGITECMGYVDDISQSPNVGRDPHIAAILVMSNRLHVLKFFISAYALALRVGWPIDVWAMGDISKLVNDFDIRNTGLPESVQESLTGLFHRGLKFLKRDNVDVPPDVSQIEQWLKELETFEISKEGKT
jgi:hypothetical protein